MGSTPSPPLLGAAPPLSLTTLLINRYWSTQIKSRVVHRPPMMLLWNSIRNLKWRSSVCANVFVFSETSGWIRVWKISSHHLTFLSGINSSYFRLIISTFQQLIILIFHQFIISSIYRLIISLLISSFIITAHLNTSSWANTFIISPSISSSHHLTI